MEANDSQIVEVSEISAEGCGPILRRGEVADAVLDAIADDNPGKQVFVIDRGDYVRINTLGECRLTRRSMERCLGREFHLPRIEIDMPSFAGRIRTTDSEITWYHNH
jgi:toluene monooxygenase system protein D